MVSLKKEKGEASRSEGRKISGLVGFGGGAGGVFAGLGASACAVTSEFATIGAACEFAGRAACTNHLAVVSGAIQGACSVAIGKKLTATAFAIEGDALGSIGFGDALTAFTDNLCISAVTREGTRTIGAVVFVGFVAIASTGLEVCTLWGAACTPEGSHQHQGCHQKTQLQAHSSFHPYPPISQVSHKHGFALQRSSSQVVGAEHKQIRKDKQEA